ncbi:ImmA/IrrE family metallo-endopeptidase [Roseateles amylovorans]|uniref:ImmA/IrrE family metallo-endopeptidase n=1 Tax=Roseateles amylovorans TaxID=2978473 RepID=A0ABY6B1G2_9BURK|nr:ImmA/IrrE family metallo-endopeptidase [Roseateles amylovorans]UXH79047.1 ImmA/IrrE family metallo-endopeptidase [Roseateles amylovorans]
MKPDDSSLQSVELAAVERQARTLLDRASAWGRYPTPIDDILEAAKLRVAPRSMFDPAAFLAFVKRKTAEAAHTLKTALSKVLGLYDANEQIIHIDETVGRSKQTFLKLHETGHHELPTHRKIFRLFQDCEQTLAPAIADQFEREANNFARFALFQGGAFRDMAADMAIGVRTPITLSKKFGASIYASAREFARSHHRACLVIVLEPLRVVPGQAAVAEVRRVEASPSFTQRFGNPTLVRIASDEALGQLLPIGRKMTKPTPLAYRDRNGDVHECLGEAFDTKHNILILIYPTKELAGSMLVLPSHLQPLQ